jgi:two-component system cell cycle sensor histidine kinase/response regulator CckA
MKDESKTKEQLIEELMMLRERLTALEECDAKNKRSEVELLKSGERYREIMQLSTAAIISCVDGRISLWNKAAEQVFGYRSDEALGMEVLTIIPEQYRDAHLAALENVREKGELRLGGKVVDLEGLRRDGTTFPIEMSVVANTDKTSLCCTVIVRDITDRRLAEDALRESENKFRSFIENTPNILLTITRDGEILYMNRAPEGLDTDHVIGTNMYTFMDSGFHELVKEHVRNVFNEGKAIQYETRGIGPNGRQSDYLSNIGPVFGVHGEIVSAIISTQDITDRKKSVDMLAASEKRYRDQYENSPLGYQSLDAEGRFVEANPSLCQMLGYDRNQVIGKWFGDFLTPGSAEKFKNNFPKFKAKGEVHAAPFEMVAKDGNVFSVVIDGRIGHDEQGNFKQTHCVITDITERKRTDEEMKNLDKLQSVGVLAGGIAHDFNNLLTAIIGSIDLAKMWLDPTHKSYGILALAEKSVMKGSELSKRLITFSSGGTPVKKVLALSALIKESAELSLSGADAYLKVHLPDGLWPVEGDEGQINQVINNLTRNGAQAMQAIPGGGTVTVSAENVEILPEDPIPIKEGRYVKVTVEDHGQGIPEDIQGKVFDPYFTTKGMGSTKGTGLGLAIVHSIVKEHGGHISFDSKAGEGTTFYFYLPASEKECPAREEAQKVKVELPKGKGRVLILEDDEPVHVVLAGLLEKLGYEAVVAKEGGEAIRAYKEAMGKKKPFDILIVDLVIRGGMGGKKAMEELLKVDPKITALVSSGYTRDPAVLDCKKYGFMGTLTKPYTAENLQAVLKRFLGNDS